MPFLRRWRLILLLFAILPGAPAAATDKPKAADAEAALPERHRRFLEEVAPLITVKEREAFLALKVDYQRDAFIREFWRARDPFPQTARNEFKERWDVRMEAARKRFSDLTDDRARMLLLNGQPAHVVQSLCPDALLPLEIWIYDKNEIIHSPFSLVFVQPQGAARGRYRLWHPSEGWGALVSLDLRARGPERSLPAAVAEACPRGEEVVGDIGGAIDWSRVEASVPVVPRPTEEWLATFSSYSTELPPGAQALPAQLDLSFPGRFGGRTVVQGLLSVPRGEVKPVDLQGFTSFNFVVDGEILHKDELFEHFRYRFTVPEKAAPAAVAGAQAATIPLVFQRYLRPGPYRLIVKLEDAGGRRYFRDERELEVPAAADPPHEVAAAAAAGSPAAASPPPSTATATARPGLLAEANASLHAGDHTVRILPAPEGMAIGRLRVEAVTTGEGIARVAFLLNGKPVMAKNHEPYNVELNLGDQPKVHTLDAVALGPGGLELARDEMQLNTGPHRLAVRLIEPQPGKLYRQSLRAQAEVKVPEGDSLERVEFYLNDDLVATLYQPPFAQPIVLPPGQGLTYVRAVAYLADGNSSEDVVMVNAPPGAKVNVDLVELYTTVLDNRGRPVEGLERKDFAVVEDGAPQVLQRFDVVKDVPIYAGILLDTSGSMAERLDEAVRGALRFFQKVITPKDRASVITFNEKPNLAVRFTNNPEVLAGGLANLTAEGNTSLYDSLIYALYTFGGIKGKRAIVLLTDGKDVGSHYRFSDALDYARRTGVTIYSVGMGLTTTDADVRSKLQRLAEETGGRIFLIEKATELEKVYATIEKDLRTQYLLAYESTETNQDKFRTIEVKVDRPGLAAKTVRGYYP